MGHRINEQYFLTREEVQRAATALKDIRCSYSEIYLRGIFPCRVLHPETGEPTDGFRLETEEFYG